MGDMIKVPRSKGNSTFNVRRLDAGQLMLYLGALRGSDLMVLKNEIERRLVAWDAHEATKSQSEDDDNG